MIRSLRRHERRLTGGSVVWLAIIQISNPLLCFDWMFEAIVQFGNAETPPQWGCDRRARKQMARRRPAPPGWGSLACWLRCSLLTDRCGYARRSRLASKPNSLQQNRNLFLNEP